MTDDQCDRLGIVKHDPDHTYDRVDRAFTKLAGLLETGHAGPTAKDLANKLALAAVPDAHGFRVRWLSTGQTLRPGVP